MSETVVLLVSHFPLSGEYRVKVSVPHRMHLPESINVGPSGDRKGFQASRRSSSDRSATG